MQGNLYTFGCSFAQYSWPMWPDIISQNYNITKNYGQPGGGNFYIFHNATILLLSGKVKNTDTVIIQWTEPARTDYADINDNWVGAGSMNAELLIKAKLDFLISDKTSIMKTLTYMVNIISLLENIGCNWYFMYMTPESIVHSLKISELFLNSNLFYTYNALIKKILPYKHRCVDSISMSEFYHDKNIPVKTCYHYTEKHKMQSYRDDHPIPIHTLAYIKEVVSLTIPTLNITKMEEYVNEIMKLFGNQTQLNIPNLTKGLLKNKKLLNFKHAIDSRNINE